MNLRSTFLLLFLAVVGHLFAQDAMQIFRKDKVCLIVPIASIDSVCLSENDDQLFFYAGGGISELLATEIDSITFGNYNDEILISYNENVATAVNPYAFRGLDISIANGKVTVINQLDTELTYRLTGQGTGSFKLYSSKKQILLLENLRLTATDGPAINIQSKKKTTLLMASDSQNSLVDAKTYTTNETEDQKGALFSEGQLVFCGEGLLEVEGCNKHAICSDDYIQIQGGNLVIKGAVEHGVHAKDYFEIDGGRLKVSMLTDESKAIKSNGHIYIRQGEVHLDCSGGPTVTDGEPSFCAALKSDSSIYITGGNLNITHSGIAGKGISADGDVVVESGNISIKTTGNGGTYTNASNQSDTYNAICIKADGNCQLRSGTLELSATGSGGKCVSCDGELVLGGEESSPTIIASTQGGQVSGSSNQGGWPGGGGNRPGRPEPGGNENGGGGGSPKAIRCEGDITIHAGEITITTTGTGGEGIESKTNLTVNGGTLVLNTYDDALQGCQSITINGGNIFANASNNDGIDANGPITVNGGAIVSCGTNQPEEGFDCDQNPFKITGGILVGVGGATSRPSGNTQPAVIYSGRGTQNTLYSICSSEGEHVMSFLLPRSYNSMTMLCSSPGLKTQTSYQLYSGGNIEGGEAFQGLTWGGVFTSGSPLSSFTVNSMLTNLR